LGRRIRKGEVKSWARRAPEREAEGYFSKVGGRSEAVRQETDLLRPRAHGFV